MEQHFTVEDEFHDIKFYAFRDGAPRPDEAKRGDEIQLSLVSTNDGCDTVSELDLTAKVTWREDYNMYSYELTGVAESLARRVTVVVDRRRPDMDGVKLQYLWAFAGR